MPISPSKTSAFRTGMKSACLLKSRGRPCADSNFWNSTGPQSTADGQPGSLGIKASFEEISATAASKTTWILGRMFGWDGLTERSQNK
jgi:hypothetical protein